MFRGVTTATNTGRKKIPVSSCIFHENDFRRTACCWQIHLPVELVHCHHNLTQQHYNVTVCRGGTDAPRTPVLGQEHWGRGGIDAFSGSDTTNADMSVASR
jgi:hypothetical protein